MSLPVEKNGKEEREGEGGEGRGRLSLCSMGRRRPTTTRTSAAAACSLCPSSIHFQRVLSLALSSRALDKILSTSHPVQQGRRSQSTTGPSTSSIDAQQPFFINEEQEK